MKKVFVSILALAIGTMISTGAMAVVPDMIPVQGVLADADDAPVDGLVDMTFTLYDAETAGTSLWTDSFTDVDVDLGFFTVYLGSGTALDFSTLLTNDEVWLGVTVDTDPEMTRVPFYTVPFAIEAQVCERVGSLTEADINTNFLPSSYTPSWTTLTDIPSGFADNTDDGYATEAELTTLLDDNYAPASHTHAWGDLTSVPAGFSDGVDNVDDTVSWSEISGIVGTAASTVAAGNHNHNSTYVNVTGDTMTGNLTVNADLAVADAFSWGGNLFSAASRGYLGVLAWPGYACTTVCNAHSLDCSVQVGPYLLPAMTDTTCATTSGERLCGCWRM